MNCPECTKEIIADKLFCNWCDVFIPNLKVCQRKKIKGYLMRHVNLSRTT